MSLPPPPPPGGVAYSDSQAYALDGAQQVGFVRVSGIRLDHASLWSGRPDSHVDLHPGGWYGSYAYGVYGGRQVGVVFAESPFLARASLWSGSAPSWVNLHAFLPAGFTESQALGIWSDGPSNYVVVGWGRNSATARIEALMWVGRAPSGDCDGDGDVDLTDYGSFADSTSTPAARLTCVTSPSSRCNSPPRDTPQGRS